MESTINETDQKLNVEIKYMPDKKVKAVGSRASVMHGTAHHTSGGLTANDLKYNEYGNIVSKKKSELSKKLYERNGLVPGSKEHMSMIRPNK